MVENSCPVKLTLSLISSKWKVLIIHELLSGKKRYGQLERTLSPILRRFYQKIYVNWKQGL